MPDSLLRELAEEAPPLRPGFADDVVAEARRRARQRWTLTGAVLAAALVAVGVPIAIQLGRGAHHPVATSRDPSRVAIGGPSATAQGTSIVGPRTVRSDGPAATYAAAVRYAVDALPRGGGVLVVDAVCPGAETGLDTRCAGRLPAGARAAIVRAVPQASFVVAPPRFSPADRPNPSSSYLLLGPLHTGDGATTVWIEQNCGFDCVQGTEYTLRQVHGTWTVTGTGAGYIS